MVVCESEPLKQSWLECEDTGRQSELTNALLKQELLTGGTHAERLSSHPFSDSKRLYLFCVIRIDLDSL